MEEWISIGPLFGVLIENLSLHSLLYCKVYVIFHKVNHLIQRILVELSQAHTQVVEKVEFLEPLKTYLRNSCLKRILCQYVGYIIIVIAWVEHLLIV